MKKIVLQHKIIAALLAALLAIISPFSLPVGSIPLTLSSFGVYLCALLAGGGWGTVSVAVYLLLGAVGVPVFSGFVGGVQAFAGPTGGFLLGYLPCTLLSGFLCRRFENKRPLLWGVALLIGTAVLYLCGVIWFMLSADVTLWAALVACVLPFLPGDIVKIVAAISLAYPVKKALQKQK